MARVLVLNNYPFEEVWEEVKRGEKPDHHLYGLNHFASAGYEVEIIPFLSTERGQKLNALARRTRFPIPLGDLDQQAELMRRLRKRRPEQGDVVYAPCQTQTQALCYMRALGLLKIPIICLAHHPLESGRLQLLRRPFNSLFVRGCDAFPSLSQGVAHAVNGLRPPSKLQSNALSWGPDATFYGPRTLGEEAGEGVVAVGRTGRDFQTFGVGASLAGTPARIVCLTGSVSAAFEKFAANVEVSVEPDEGYMKYPELLSIYARARALAIPLLPGPNLAGLTSLLDALGMGKPVIMTRHALIDLDIESLGIGLWVEPGDVEGWRRALEFFEHNPARALEMGRRARALVDEGFNSAVFAQQVVDLFHHVTAAQYT